MTQTMQKTPTTTDTKAGEAPVLDEARAEAFVHKALGDVSAATTVLLASLGDRLGLYATLASHGPATSTELAVVAEIDERYAREWLGGMAAAGYLDYTPDTERFTLPREHEQVLVTEGSPVFFGGFYQQMGAIVNQLDAIATAFTTGGGVASTDYNDSFWTGLERFTAGWFENFLLQEWIPAMPAVQESLTAGVDVADVGCGNGRALVKLATHHPKSRFVGYDVHPDSVARARQAVEEAGVADRVRIEQLDVAEGLPEQFDVIFTFDVVHDAVDPAGLLASIKAALRPAGRYVCVDIAGSDKVEENTGPIGALFYGISVLYCMTSSLAHNGTGLGTLGFNPKVVDEMCQQAGFESVRMLDLDNPFNNVYEIH